VEDAEKGALFTDRLSAKVARGNAKRKMWNKIKHSPY
jgi:hypothetical protein